MTKPTNEERREVAARLRDYERLRTMFTESNVCAFSDALGAGYLDWEQICARLADLIEPEPERACRMERSSYYFKTEVTTWFCSECGSPIYNDVAPSFCLYCGAKVVDE